MVDNDCNCPATNAGDDVTRLGLRAGILGTSNARDVVPLPAARAPTNGAERGLLGQVCRAGRISCLPWEIHLTGGRRQAVEGRVRAAIAGAGGLGRPHA